jgi:L-lactate dehydrogenase complex protein LldG
MSTSSQSRQQILKRIYAATGSEADRPEQAAAAWSALPRGYIRMGSMSAEARIERMVERLREYDAEVTECAPDELPGAIATQLRASGKRSIVAPAGVPREWLTTGYDWKIDYDLQTEEIERADGVLTACFCAIADSGTIVLHHSASEGRRVITLLPDWHLCVLKASQIVETLPEYFARCQTAPALVTTISGPSATADIEMTRIKGVHGPRFMNVILVRDDGSKTSLN